MSPPFALWSLTDKLSADRTKPGEKASRVLLESSGLRRTIARTLVMDLLLDQPDRERAFTTAWIQSTLADRGHAVAMTSIHRVVEALHCAGFIEPASGR